MRNTVLRLYKSIGSLINNPFVLLIGCFLICSCYGPDMYDLASRDASKESPEPSAEDENNENNENSMKVILDSVISGDGFVKIVWADPDTDKFTSINIYNGSDNALKTSVEPGVEQVILDGLSNGTKYSFIIRVKDDVGMLGPDVRVSAIPDTVVKDYILIHNAQELNAVRNNLSADYLVVEDIDLAGAYTPWVPIGENSSAFTGTFNGNGHIIENIKITDDYTVKGLFGYIGNGSAQTRVTDVVLTGFQLTASNTSSMEYIGAIAGYCHNALIQNCDVSGTISVNGKATIGGITGVNASPGVVEDCESDVVIEGTYNNNNPVGGLVGVNHGLITNSVARVDIDVNTRIGTGGIAGSSVSGATITYCSVNVKKIRSNEKVGGIVGANNGVVNYCDVSSNNGSITGTKWVGGFVGTYGEGYVTGPSSVNLGLVSGSELAGGFAGQVSAGGINGPINIKIGKVQGAANVGGFAGQIGSDTSPSPVIVSVDDVSVQADVEYNGTSPSSEEDAFIGGFAGFIINTNSCSISNSSFNGDVNASHKINIGGFIGNVDKATVTINDSYVTGSKVDGVKYVGGFVGAVTDNTSILIIDNCSSSAEIKGGTAVGGFVGYINSSKIIFTDVASHGSIVASYDSSGGFAGSIIACSAGSSIKRAYSRASLSGNNIVGGFAGSVNSMNLTISQAYAAGKVTGSKAGGFAGRVDSISIEYCFFDRNVTEQPVAVYQDISGVPSSIYAYTTTQATTINTDVYSYWGNITDNPFSSSGYNWIIHSSCNDNYPYPVSFYNLWGSDVP